MNGASDICGSGADASVPSSNSSISNFTPQQIGGAVSKLLSADIGDIAVLFSRSPAHKHYTFADIEWMILPAVISGQAYIAELQHKEHGARAPVAAVLWARVSTDVDARLTANISHKLRLRADEWQSGEIHWIIDIAGEAHAIAGALAELAQTQLKGNRVSLVVADADGVLRIQELHALLTGAAETDARAS